MQALLLFLCLGAASATQGNLTETILGKSPMTMNIVCITEHCPEVFAKAMMDPVFKKNTKCQVRSISPISLYVRLIFVCLLENVRPNIPQRHHTGEAPLPELHY
jgi:hypothetical protein